MERGWNYVHNYTGYFITLHYSKKKRKEDIKCSIVFCVSFVKEKSGLLLPVPLFAYHLYYFFPLTFFFLEPCLYLCNTTLFFFTILLFTKKKVGRRNQYYISCFFLLLLLLLFFITLFSLSLFALHSSSSNNNPFLHHPLNIFSLPWYHCFSNRYFLPY